MPDIDERKSGASSVDPDDFNAVVDAVKTLQDDGGGGTGLPTGWTQDEADPANVTSNGGDLELQGGDYRGGVAFLSGVTLQGPDLPPTVRAITVDPTAGGGNAAPLGSIRLRDNGQAWLKTGAGNTDWTQIGGVPSGAFAASDFLFTETAGAGTYTATLAVPSGTVVVDVLVYNLAVWDADTCEFTVADGSHSYYAGRDLGTAYDPTNLTVGANYTALGTAEGEEYVSAAWSQAAGVGSVGPGVRYATSDTITMTVVTSGAGGTTGRMLMKILYFTPVTASNAVKA